MFTTVLRHRALRRILSATLLLTATLGIAPAALAHAEETVGIAIAPAKASGPDGRTRFSYQLDPGQSLKDRVVVSNAGSTPLTITLSATDAFNTEDGSYALLSSKAKPSDAGSWIRFNHGKKSVTVTLAPQKAANIPFDVTVPANATPGDHPAGVVASAVFGKGKLAVERRIASRLYVRVSGELQPILTASSFAGTYNSGLNPLDGSATVTAVLANTGNVALSGSVDVEARTWFGLVVGKPVQVELNEMLPGSTRTVSYQIDGVPQVGYVVPHLVVRGAIGPDAPDPGPLPVVQRDTFLFALPWLVLGLILLGVAGWFGWKWYTRRAELRAEEWIAHTEAEALRKAQQAADLEVSSTTAASDGSDTRGAAE